MNTTQTKLDAFTQAYVECALWSSHDNADDSGGETLDANYSINDIAPLTLHRMVRDCESFQADNAELITKAELSDARAGFCFWLNRNGHGSGFWDEYSGQNETIRDACMALSDASKVYREMDLYVGDDGMIYGQ